MSRFLWRMLKWGGVLFFVLGVYAAWRIGPVRKVQNAVDRNFEIYFFEEIGAYGKPRLVTEPFDNMLNSIAGTWSDLMQMCGYPEWDVSAMMYQERLRIPFKGPIRQIEIIYPDRIRSSLGRALSNFESLEVLKIIGDNLPDQQSSEDLVMLFKDLGKLEDLRNFEINIHKIDPAILEPLRQCDSVETLTLVGCEIPVDAEREILEIFLAMQSLKKLQLIDSYSHRPEENLSIFCDQESLLKHLPNVEVSLDVEVY